MLEFKVRDERCTRCGECVRDCPARIIGQQGREMPRILPEQEAFCIRCQHCLAICPTAAISIFGCDPDRSLPLSPEVLPTFEAMSRLIRGRRSVRRYKDENVDPAVIREWLATLANVPTGVNRRELTFSVIADKADMRRFRELGLNTLREAVKAGRIPERLSYVQQAVPAWFENQVDLIFRGAPHVLVVSASPEAPCASEDVPLALACFDLLVRSAGYGAVWCGMLKLLLEIAPELKAVLGLPANHIYYAMLFGKPAVRYPRTVQRDDAAQVRFVTLAHGQGVFT